MGVISLQSNVCKAFYPVWYTNCNCRYRAIKGGRNTGKSHNILGIEPIIKILTSKERNIIMLRANDVDNADSTYANIVQRINDLGLGHLFKCITSPYKITRKATGQVILFRGCNNPTSITSIKPTVGIFTDVYFEEASELKSYEDFRKIDGSIRGLAKDGAPLQITFAFNAWDVGHWLYDLFFKGRLEDDVEQLENKGYMYMVDPEFNLGFGKGLALHISSYKANDYRTADYDEGMEVLKKASYSLYKVEGLGCWGNTTEGCYPCWSDALVIPAFKANTYNYSDFAIGIDIGLSDGAGHVNKKGEIRAATTMVLNGLTDNCNKLVSLDEYYFSNINARVPKTEPQIQEELCQKIKSWLELYPWMCNHSIHVFVDSADKGFRESLQKLAYEKYKLRAVKFLPSTKLPVHNRISFTNHLMAFGEYEVSERCKNLIREYKQTHRGPKGEIRDGNDHTIDSYEYAGTPLWGKMRRYKNFKQTK